MNEFYREMAATKDRIINPEFYRDDEGREARIDAAIQRGREQAARRESRYGALRDAAVARAVAAGARMSDAYEGGVKIEIAESNKYGVHFAITTGQFGFERKRIGCAYTTEDALVAALMAANEKVEEA